MEQKEEYDEHFKIILLGDNFVGKSCLLQSYLGKTHLGDYCDTMGVDQEIKPLLEKQYDNYLKLELQKNHSGLFSSFRQNLTKEVFLKEEYYHSLTQFLQATDPIALDEFCIKILDLIERVDKLYQHENPYWNIISHSPLSKILRHALDVLCCLPTELVELSNIKELISKDRVVTVHPGASFPSLS